MATPARFLDALRVLAAHEVEFIVVGGVAAVLAGAPVSTFDLDIVHARTAENVVRLHAALTELDARYRDLTGRALRPDLDPLRGPGHHLLITSAGPLDVLGEIGRGLGYAELVAEGSSRTVAGMQLHVLGLEALIRLKEELGREKDRAMLAVLRRTLEESKR